MRRYGLKLWSTNRNYYDEAARLCGEGICQYIELYSVPGSFGDHASIWKTLKVPYVIHAAHFRNGMNLAKKDNEARNRELIKEAQLFADELEAEKLIVHPGIDGEIGETARQIKTIGDRRLLLENKPYRALAGGLICNGTTPEEIALVINETGCGFCLDFGHAIYSANAQGRDSHAFIVEFMLLKPSIFHLTDGERYGTLDSHRHIGQGDFNFRELISFLPPSAMVTVETDKDSADKLDDYVRDVARLREYEHA